jgi:predicted 3-demethylubiquinone-9 3-methyltransferase (glyoxalase superfamily)
MTHAIGTCLWFETEAKEASDFYKSVFKGYESISENPLAVVYNLYGRRFMHLNGRTTGSMNPAISFFVQLSDENELTEIWNKLSAAGKIMMPLNKYPWSKQYGWCTDKFGVSWQLILEDKVDNTIVPSMMFVQENNGKAAAAIEFYTTLFKESKTIAISHYEKGEPDTEGNIKYARFTLNNFSFGAMESSGPHAFTFSEAISYVITADNQEEIDYYWDNLVKEGQPGRCGWLKDKYGISWQIVPSILGKLMSNPATAPKATYAFLQMSKFIIADLEKAVAS